MGTIRKTFILPMLCLIISMLSIGVYIIFGFNNSISYGTDSVNSPIKDDKKQTEVLNKHLTFTKGEAQVIKASESAPIVVGVIPNQYPVSVGPSDGKDFEGILVDYLKFVSDKTGLKFKLVEVPTDEISPMQFLREGRVDLSLGTLKTPWLLKDKDMVTSNSLIDATSIFIGKKDLDVEKAKNDGIVVAIIKGFEAGKWSLKKNLPYFELLDCATMEESFEAVKEGRADFAIANKYVASYYMQKPVYESLMQYGAFSVEFDSCITGRSDKKEVMSVINKGLGLMTGKEHDSIILKYTIMKSSDLTIGDILYKVRHAIAAILTIIIAISALVIRIFASNGFKKQLCNDSLTGLLSGYGFEKAVERELLKAPISTFYIVDYDVVRFEAYNSMYGRELGDELIRHIAKIAKESNNPNEFTGRVYADHFVTFVKGDSIDEVISRIIDFKNTICSTEGDINIIVNFGIYFVEDNKIPVKKMIDRAIVAKRSIKGNAEKIYAVYDENLHEKNIEDANIVASLPLALKNEEFYIALQPKYDTYTEKIVGAESLVRWKKQNGEVVFPGRFIELFEKNAQIVKLDFYVFEKTCRLQKQIMLQGIEPVVLSVNFSKIHVYDTKLAYKLEKIARKYDVPTNLIEIELTETTMMNDKEHVLPVLRQLKSQGFSIAMDDFGSGFSSLKSLKDLPIDILKMDREFIMYENESDKGKIIIELLLKLTQKLNIKAVAEGVETAEQLNFLKECGGCDMVQGYYFSKPVQEEEFISMLEKEMEDKGQM